MNKNLEQRMNSLDIFRGGIILLLLLESVYFFESLDESFDLTLIDQFFHVRWDGLSFWDLIQPGFMFIAGTAMTLSLVKRSERGESHRIWLLHILKRSVVLFVLGVGLHWIYNEGPVFELQNVLTQLSVTTLITALLIRRKWWIQFSAGLILIVLTSLIYRLYNNSAPFTPGRNAGTALDVILSGHADSDHWVALNFLPTSAHTIWGALTGWILISNRHIKKKGTLLGGMAIFTITTGFILHFSGFEPMIKRISTASFVLVSGGIIMLLLLCFFYLIDYRNARNPKFLEFFIIPGRNCIFLYLFSQIVIPLFLIDFVAIFTEGIGDLFHIPDVITLFITIFAVLIVTWKILKRLYIKGITIRI